MAQMALIDAIGLHGIPCNIRKLKEALAITTCTKSNYPCLSKSYGISFMALPYGQIMLEGDQVNPLDSPDVSYCLNVDEVSNGNPGNCGGGGCIRDTNGISLLPLLIIMVWGIVFLRKPMLYLAISLGVRLSHIQSDSLLLVNSLHQNRCTFWQTYKWWREVRKMLGADQRPRTHVYHEANMVTDQLANHAVASKSNQVFWGVQSLPHSCKRSVVLDRGMPCRFCKVNRLGEWFHFTLLGWNALD
ncbi:hypothetical protein Taro_009155 [Colocasia esculenta]|uniref:RNase H type-1 domain-containing protein n=1 Tax=Colocasia esculenta TaxID=4460 RepID=A0A843U5K9_COLES|nr:hypothetical protein [Colocasia esculenta]